METVESTASDPHARTRIRDNQRRSRARRREFVDDLQRKVREYEAQGVQATLDMQRAARVVAHENARLRSLLASKGVSEEEVEGYLASPGEVCSSPAMGGSDCVTADLERRGSMGREESTGHVPRGSGRSSPASSGGSAIGTESLMCLKRLVNEDGPHPFRTLGPSPKTRETAERGPAPTSMRTTILPSLHAMSFSPHEMSCHEAAEIVASAHGHGDEQTARSALGCADSSPCVVKNTQVLQVLQNT